MSKKIEGGIIKNIPKKVSIFIGDLFKLLTPEYTGYN